MKNWKSWILIVVVVVAVISIFTIKTYGVSEVITKNEVQNPNTLENKTKIALVVLEDTGRSDIFEPQEALNVTVYSGNLMGDEKDETVFVVEFGPKNSIVAVYALNPDDETYKYIADVGEFFNVRNIMFMLVKDQNKNIMVIQEYADQTIGAFERSSFLKGYFWSDSEEKFKSVLSVADSIEAVWNGDCEEDNIVERRWQKIEQRTEIKYDDNEYPILNFTYYQSYKISDSMDKKMPDVSTFDTYRNRVVNKIYYWSNEWQRFIISEKINNANGQKVAVIEDLGASAYALIDSYGDAANNIMIQTNDGKYEVVKRNTLSNLDGTEVENMFTSYQN